MDKVKICTKCKEKKLLVEFRKDNSKKDGYYSSCINCCIEYDKIRYRIRKSEYSQRHKKYYQENKAKIKNKTQNYYLKNITKKRQYSKDHHLKHKNDIDYKNKRLEYREKNKIRLNKQIYLIHRKYYKNNISYRIKENCRGRINNALRGYTKSLSTMLLIGCEVDYLMFHLQEQFTKGMSWDNYGDWHVDHIRPCASFDFVKESEQKKCFHYTNLQPLWAKDNLSKHTKYKETK
ncbi:MAG: hypothetical protein ACTSWD_09500 [Candidatus Heimdallarchaeota archaeon]